MNVSKIRILLSSLETTFSAILLVDGTNTPLDEQESPSIHFTGSKYNTVTLLPFHFSVLDSMPHLSHSHLPPRPRPTGTLTYDTTASYSPWTTVTHVVH